MIQETEQRPERPSQIEEMVKSSTFFRALFGAQQEQTPGSETKPENE